MDQGGFYNQKENENEKKIHIIKYIHNPFHCQPHHKEYTREKHDTTIHFVNGIGRKKNCLDKIFHKNFTFIQT